MNTEYDRKFEEMKKYIPFLENMITRLESTSTSSSNPRQAQLDKIRSLRDLLSNKKKRMKMENLLKCEQVLVNLYAKVEQRDTLSNDKNTTDSGFSIDAPTQKEKSDLEAVRNKLKTVVQRQENMQDTLPEILTRNEINDVHTSGTKEPALFQRRPNQSPNLALNESDEKKSPPGSASKRNYTRVLVSPQSSSRRWSSSDSTTEKPLFSRRSPRNSLKRYSPSYYKKERKKSKELSNKHLRKQKDLNITLNVPEASLNSLNTKDILSRILNCSDGDVDIDTLRELRKQILGELKKTGAKDDISDLILKSYNKKKKSKPKIKEVEEGELSDSESEAIESIYGSLVVKEPGYAKISPNKDSQPRKIQICLVINSDEQTETTVKSGPKQDVNDGFAELEMYEKTEKQSDPSIDNNKTKEYAEDVKKTSIILSDDNKASIIEDNTISSVSESEITIKDNLTTITCDETSTKEIPITETNTMSIKENDVAATKTIQTSDENALKEFMQFKANFYKPLKDPNNLESAKLANKEESNLPSNIEAAPSLKFTDTESTQKQIERSTEIPLLHERTVEKKPPENALSEIDILQALKKEILSEIPVPGTEGTTPLLHQPKVMKVASAQELMPKKRISIEKYKEKSVTSSKSNLAKVSPKDDQAKKTSLKLTDKECERFFSVPKISFDEEDESLDDDDDDILASDVYNDLAPKSPDHDDSNNVDCAPPVIIPVDPVKTTSVNYKADIDMRTLPLLSPNNDSAIYNNVPTKKDIPLDRTKSSNRTDQINNHNRPVFVDPRVRELNTNTIHSSPNPHVSNIERTPRSTMYTVSSSSTPNRVMTPNARTYEMTPTHQLFDIEQASRKHVYVPTISHFEIQDKEISVSKSLRFKEEIDTAREKRSRIDDVSDNYWNPQRENVSQPTRFSDSINSDNIKNINNEGYRIDNAEHLYNRPDGSYGKADVPVTSNQAFKRLEAPMTPLPSFGRSDCATVSHPYGRLDCPPTPTHNFGRLDCPPTPNHPFGRTDCASTPSHQFERVDCPPTPSHPFGRTDCPPTPVHSFGRTDCPPTPSHQFGRLECPPTPNHPFGRGDGLLAANQPFERVDCPSTPSHPFGRADGSLTSGHPFNRSEGPPPLMHNLIDAPSTPYTGVDCSLTPTHFGRNECPPTPSRIFSPPDCVPSQSQSYNYHEQTRAQSHHFGRQTKNQCNRADFSVQKYIKDPRLNRKVEFESKSQFDDRDHGVYKDRERCRGSSYSSPKMYSKPDQYRNHDREQIVSRNKYKYYAPELRERLFNNEHRRDHNVGSSFTKDREIEKLGNRDNRYNSDTRYSEDRGPRREYYHEKSARRSVRQEDSLSSARASSVRNNSRDRDGHKLTVASNSGRSFTIDTSVNATFQKIIDSAKEIQGFVNSFDSRRKRAASVGRFLVRESSVGRTLSPSVHSNHSESEDKRKAFRRASSVGRELLDNTDGRSFQEIKADFKTYKLSVKQSSNREKTESSKTHKTQSTSYPERSRKDICEREKGDKPTKDSKNSYSPRKNNRDPRLRRQFDKNNDKSSPDTNSRKSGIVYSNDNIVTGSIMTSGYGVKNYKIPKIKRPTIEKETIIENVDTVIKRDETVKDVSAINDKIKENLHETDNNIDESQKNKECKDVINEIEPCETTREGLKKSIVTVHSSEEQCCKRETRSSKINKLEPKIDTEGIIKTKKKSRKIIYDSESDDEITSEDRKNVIRTKDDGTQSEIKIKASISPNKENCMQEDSTKINLSYRIDELEMFSDKFDPVVDNINALIADLDNDLNASKNYATNNFTNEISVENMMQNISSPGKDNKLEFDDESEKIIEAIDNISDGQVEIPNNAKTNQAACQDDVTLNASRTSQGESAVQDYLKNSMEPVSTQIDTLQRENNGNLNKITTSTLVEYNNDDIVSTTEVEKHATPIEDKPRLIEDAAEGRSTPDSTINTDDPLHKSNDKNSVSAVHEVTSTETVGTKPSSSAKETVPDLNSIGSLLAILQDKSKMKQLLTMINDKSSENEKIKKKLEKLSEIVSDDEEAHEPVEKGKIEKCSVINQKIERDKKIEDVSNNQSDNEIDQDVETLDDGEALEIDTGLGKEGIKTKNNQVKKTKTRKKVKGRQRKISSIVVKRVTRSNAPEVKQKVKKPPRELMQLREDLKEMFLGDDVLSATGIRMCRLAKMSDTNTSNTLNTKAKDTQPKEELVLPDVGPVVILEKYKSTKVRDSEKAKKKIGPKIKMNALNDDSIYDSSTNNDTPTSIKYKVGPKSKTKIVKESDPYAFETDSVGKTNTEKVSDDGSSNTSDSECESLASFRTFESTEFDVKKKTKRKRRGWQAGVIKPKTKKKKVEPKTPVRKIFDAFVSNKLPVSDLSCFTDRNYCFQKNQSRYSCRFCEYSGDDIVLHYRYQHPHVEVPLSRMSPDVAKEAIEKCEEINFNAVIKVPSDKYVCIFCFKEFINCKFVLETFFWHIVSTHTGEFKQNCSQCDNAIECPFKLDIPPPPEDYKKQLIGYMCKKCNFTQLSVENLKTHVIMRHDDNQTTVYTINLSFMSKEELKALLSRSDTELMQSSIPISDQADSDISEKLNDSVDGCSESEGERTPLLTRTPNISAISTIQSKITFEADDNIGELSDLVSDIGENTIKSERIESNNMDEICEEYSPSKDVIEFDTGTVSNVQVNKFIKSYLNNDTPVRPPENSEIQPCNDILNFPHFKINLTDSGGKEYFCCINGNCYFKTTLLISMKKHVQTKHFENWDGYCYVCKVIVTPQGAHKFRDCLQHYLDKHMDDFPMIEKESIKAILPQSASVNTESLVEEPVSSKPKINVRPISELTVGTETVSQEKSGLPVIQSIMSFGPSPLSSTYSVITQEEVEQKIFKYEEHQAEVISKKYYLVVQAMMSPDNLIKVFKCSGRYCSYATDCTRDALAHATTHQRIGGADALNCSYCDFGSAGNAVDLVMHVFKTHGCCQYCCQQCFYRAASSQAVAAHMSRIHGVIPVPGSVLRTTAVSSIPVTKHTILTREEAVPYYFCGHGDGDAKCKFRVYTPDKFCEHLEQRHGDASEHPCHWCSEKSSTATEMVQHMKVHGIMLYQCTWCVYGADNERDLLDHISILHPDKPPQAYIRIITNKDGAEKRVLPLVLLNKHKVPTKDLEPTTTKEHPEREAKRSIEMEALIAPFVNDSNENFEETIDTDTIESSEISEAIIGTTVKDNSSTKVQVQESSVAEHEDAKTSIVAKIPEVTQVTSDVSLPNASNTSPSIMIKTEHTEELKSSFVDILVLDSDDETSTTMATQPVIDLSDDEPSTSNLKSQGPIIVPLKDLHKCPQCKLAYKTMGGLKKHMVSCVKNTSEIKCPHCLNSVENLAKLMFHYWALHTTNKTLECELCGHFFVSEIYARKHFRSVHKAPNVVITQSVKDGLTYFLVSKQEKPPGEAAKESVAPKRKMSGSKSDTIPFKRRYEPQEIDQLPINPILDQLVYCSQCEFSTKVRLNMVRHLQLHAEQQPVPQTVPVNPVPHLESNEKHFDKMVNLASSSVVNRTPDKQRSESTPSVTLLIPMEAASRYPKYVPERQRHTCGAKGCSYISVDEAMLRRHWDTLHAGTSDFHCVHCPPHQHLDTSKPLTATRILSHLKMHDSTLYACSLCTYYHYKREALEKHLSEIHKEGRLMIVREESSSTDIPVTAQVNTAPTMDLKPWQCGLCKFKSMLHPEVVDHCFKIHQSKMQFKCAYCPFRTSAVENVSKHQANSHAGNPEEVFYYFYREGSIPDEPDGTPRWVKQRQKAGPSEPEIKVEASCSDSPIPKITPVISPISVDLNLVKKEVDVPNTTENKSMEELCKIFGSFCEPNGIKFKCPLCKVIMEETKEGMQSHLYEELNYRKWSCGLCSYKAFHKTGLTDHMISEHGRQYDLIELPVNVNIEKWVNGVLEHQDNIIGKHKINLMKQKIVVAPKPGPSTEIVAPKVTVASYSEEVLEKAFGPFGQPKESMFCCARCGFLSRGVDFFRDHLETELNKIRWHCSNCPEVYQTYHETRFHCRGHDGPARPIEAIRDQSMRAVWVSTAIQKQKACIQSKTPSTETTTPEKVVPYSDNDNSLLAVRYEENVPAEELSPTRKRPAPDSDDDKLVIDEGKKKPDKSCPYCGFKSNNSYNLKIHMLRHFNLRQFSCCHCEFNGSTRNAITKHCQQVHPGLPFLMKKTELPQHAIQAMEADGTSQKSPAAVANTVLPNIPNEMDTVTKCEKCFIICKNIKSMQEHYNIAHPFQSLHYTLYNLEANSKCYDCTYCTYRFLSFEHLKDHHTAIHSYLPFKTECEDLRSEADSQATTSSGPVRRCARKSTTKLPNAFAKKSTTKLPYNVPDDDDGFSYYGTKPPQIEEFSEITTLMSFCNRLVPFSMKQLSEHLNIEPLVKLTDMKNSSD